MEPGQNNSIQFPGYRKHSQKYQSIAFSNRPVSSQSPTYQSYANADANVNRNANANVNVNSNRIDGNADGRLLNNGCKQMGGYNYSNNNQYGQPIVTSLSIVRKQENCYNDNQQQHQNQNTLAKLLMFQSGDLNSREHLSSANAINSHYANRLNRNEPQNQHQTDNQNRGNILNNSSSGVYGTYEGPNQIKYVSSQYMTNSEQNQSQSQNSKNSNPQNLIREEDKYAYQYDNKGINRANQNDYPGGNQENYYNYTYKRAMQKDIMKGDKENLNRFTNSPLYESEYQYIHPSTRQPKNEPTNRNYQQYQPNNQLELSQSSSNEAPNRQLALEPYSESESEDLLYNFITKFVLLFSNKVKMNQSWAFQALCLPNINNFAKYSSQQAMYERGFHLRDKLNNNSININNNSARKQMAKKSQISQNQVNCSSDQNYGAYSYNYYAQSQKKQGQPEEELQKQLQARRLRIKQIQKQVKAREQQQQTQFNDQMKAKKNQQSVFQFAVPKDMKVENQKQSTIKNMQSASREQRWWQGQNHQVGLSSISSIQQQDNHMLSMTSSYNYNTSTYNYNNYEVPKRKHIFAIEEKDKNNDNKFSRTFPSTMPGMQSIQPTGSPNKHFSKTQGHQMQKNANGSNMQMHGMGQNNYQVPTFKIIYEQQEQSNANTNSNIVPTNGNIQFNFNTNIRAKAKRNSKKNSISPNSPNNYGNNVEINYLPTKKENEKNEQAYNYNYQKMNVKTLIRDNNVNLTQNKANSNSGNPVVGNLSLNNNNSHPMTQVWDNKSKPIAISMSKMGISARPLLDKNISINSILTPTPQNNEQSTVSQVQSPNSRAIIKKGNNPQPLEPINPDQIIKNMVQENGNENQVIVYMFNNLFQNERNLPPQRQGQHAEQGDQNSQDTQQYGLHLQSNGKNKGSDQKRQNYQDNDNVAYINVGEPLQFQKIPIAANNIKNPPSQAKIQANRSSNIGQTQLRPVSSLVTNTNSIIFQNKNRAVSPQQRPVTYNPQPNAQIPILKQPMPMMQKIEPQLLVQHPQFSPQAQMPNARPTVKLNISNIPVIEIQNKVVRPVSSLAQSPTNANVTKVQFSHVQSPIIVKNSHITIPPEKFVNNVNTIRQNQSPRAQIPVLQAQPFFQGSPPKNTRVFSENSPPHIKILQQNKEIAQPKKVFITYNENQSSKKVPQNTGQLSRPVSQPNLRPLSSLVPASPKNEINNINFNPIHQQKLISVRENYYGNNQPGFVINNRVISQSPIMRESKSTPALVKINFGPSPSNPMAKPVNMMVNNNVIRNNGPVTNVQAQSPQGYIKLQPAKKPSPIGRPISNMEQTANQQAGNANWNNNRAVNRPSSSAEGTPVSDLKKIVQNNQQNNMNKNMNTNSGLRMDQTIINNLQTNHELKNQGSIPRTTNKSAFIDGHVSGRKQPSIRIVHNEYNDYNVEVSRSPFGQHAIPSKQPFNFNQSPRQLPSMNPTTRNGMNTNSNMNANINMQNGNGVNPLYQQYHDVDSRVRPGSNRKKLNVVCKQQQLANQSIVNEYYLQNNVPANQYIISEKPRPQTHKSP